MRYALVDKETMTVVNVFTLPDGEPWDTPDIYLLISSDTASVGDIYADGEFSAPPRPVKTPEEIAEFNRQQQAGLMAQASQSMTPLFMSLQLGDATDEETVMAKAWQAYYRALKLVDITVAEPVWPDSPV